MWCTFLLSNISKVSTFIWKVASEWLVAVLLIHVLFSTEKTLFFCKQWVDDVLPFILCWFSFSLQTHSTTKKNSTDSLIKSWFVRHSIHRKNFSYWICSFIYSSQGRCMSRILDREKTQDNSFNLLIHLFFAVYKY